MDDPRGASPTPLDPPRCGGPAPRLPGGYALSVDNFFVDEVPLYEPSGSGEHLWARIEKRGQSTMFLVDRLASVLGCPAREIGYAGLKDRHAVTRQWFSFPASVETTLAELDLDDTSVLERTRHDNKLKLGHLRGNRFTIELDCDSERVADVAANLRELGRRGVPNYFGAQRFGSGGRNLEKGLRILHADSNRATRRLRKPVLRLLLSSVQSEVFNRVLAARIESFDRLQDGDVAWLHHNGACFFVEEALAEKARCDRFEISPSGPLPGPKCLATRGAQGELEARVAEELGVAPAMFARFKSNPGERRALRTRLREPRVAARPGGVRLEFELERGAFATTVLRELVDEPPWVVADDVATD